MELYHRRLPHWIPEEATFFVGWRLAGSPPPPKPEFLNEVVTRSPGPLWLNDPRVAQVVADALIYGADVKKLYDLHAWVIMPNHVHVVWRPNVELRRITHWIKRSTAYSANRILGRRGPFWQDESYDHWIRSQRELGECMAYVEMNPVKAGLVESVDQWRWSSAWKAS